jgi:hypothetical protein
MEVLINHREEAPVDERYHDWTRHRQAGFPGTVPIQPVGLCSANGLRGASC